MKKLLIALSMVLLLAVAGAGCTAPGGGDQEPPITDRGEHLVYPAPVTDWLEQVKPMFLAGHLESEGTEFVMVNWGEKPSAGYNVRIAEVSEEADRVVVKVDFTYPGDAAAQVLTYPSAVEALEFDSAGREIVFEDLSDREYIPRVVGLDELPPFLSQGAPNIKLFSFEKGEGQARVAGIARAFEANINYDLEDANKEVLRSGFSTAATAGPDWGYFEFHLEDLPAEAEGLVIYTVNMEDGSRWDVVVLEL